MNERVRGGTGAVMGAAAYAVISAALLPLTLTLGTAAVGARADLGQLVGLAAALAAWVTLLWAALVTVLPLVAAAACGTGSALFHWTSALGPRSARHLVATVLGAGLVGATVGAALPAGAAEITSTAPFQASSAARAAPAGGTAPDLGPNLGPDLDRPALSALSVVALPLNAGWTPDRPVAPHRQRSTEVRAARLVTGTVTPGRHVLDHVVVRRGDSLWDIATRHLGPDACAADIAREWPRWHAANRAVIGPDPALLLPGQQLVAPAAR